MAGPTFGSAGTPSSGTTATTVAVPVPSGVVSGSIIVIALYRGADGTGGSYDALTSVASGFSLATHNPGITGNGVFHTACLDVLVKRASASDSGTYSFSWTTSAFTTGVAVRIDGATSSGTPYEDDQGAASAAATTTTPAVSCTTAGADRLLVFAGAAWDGDTWTPPTGFTQRALADFNLTIIADKAQVAAGSSGTVQGSTPSSEPKCGWVGAFFAAAAAPQPTAIGGGGQWTCF